MRGIIIAGGFGTRLQPLTFGRPKHLLPLGNRPFLEFQVALLRRHDITEVVFATNYLSEMIEAHFGDGSAFGVAMTYALESEPLGTAGAIRNAWELCGEDAAVVLNGDILTDFDLTALLAAHSETGADGSIALRSVARPHGFGVIETTDTGRLTAWLEPTEEQKRAAAAHIGPPTGGSDYINAGIYILEPQVIRRIPRGRQVSIERETYPELIREGASLYGHVPEGYWMDIGRPVQYLAANEAVLTGAVRTDVAYRAVADTAGIAKDAIVDAATSVGPGASIGAGSSLRKCIILGGVHVGARAQLNGVIADEGAVIGDDVTGGPGVVLSGDCVIGRGTRL